MPMLQQTTGEGRLADHKRHHQRAGIAVLTAIPTNSRRIPSRTARKIVSAGIRSYCRFKIGVHPGNVGEVG